MQKKRSALIEEEQAARVATVKPGETAAISWPFTAGKARRPYVVFFEPDGDRLAGVDATGAIVR